MVVSRGKWLDDERLQVNASSYSRQTPQWLSILGRHRKDTVGDENEGADAAADGQSGNSSQDKVRGNRRCL